MDLKEYNEKVSSQGNSFIMIPSSDRINVEEFFPKSASIPDNTGNRKRPAGNCARPKKRTRICRSDDDFNPIPVCVLKRPKTTVDHSYYDYSGYQTKCDDKLDYNSDTSESTDLSLGLKLHEILNKFPGYCSWQPHGRAFKITIPKKFEMKVCPKYFGHSRYSTFLRQLNNHGFKHITQGSDRNCYYHEAFLRGIPAATKFMPPPRNRRRLIPDPKYEPDFYRISASFPLRDIQCHADKPIRNQERQNHNDRDEKVGSDSYGNTELTRLSSSVPSGASSGHGISLTSLPLSMSSVQQSGPFALDLDQIAKSAYTRALIERTQQLDYTRDRILQNLKKENELKDMIMQLQQQELMKASVLSSQTPQHQSDLNPLLTSLLANNVSPVGGLSLDLQPSMLHSPLLQTAQSQDSTFLQLLKEYQKTNSPFNL